MTNDQSQEDKLRDEKLLSGIERLIQGEVEGLKHTIELNRKEDKVELQIELHKLRTSISHLEAKTGGNVPGREERAWSGNALLEPRGSWRRVKRITR